METIYPPGPTAVPSDLTQATPAYKRRAWLAMAGLAGFVALYLALTGWFAWIAWHLATTGFGGSGHAFWGFVVAGCAGFLALFMVKALFFFRGGKEASAGLEITAVEQPRLFGFLHRLADEARAPRPHRVFLSPRVNAAVFYDLSLFNLLLPSKKNLEIGLGLVNVLSLGELKAVLAHEFGHFAQRSMAVGRWVYVAQQIAGAIIAKRDALDRFLQGLSRIDLRIAWIGWLLSLIVWSIRSLMESAFRLVVLAQRALSREMELQADLVAVSLTGSDALVHALHHLHIADEAWDRTLNFAGGELRAERRVVDLFAVQTRVIGHLRGLFDQPEYGHAPPLPAEQPQHHRLFKAGLAQPPRMWATHPANTEREANAKRIYIAADCDARDAWTLFDDVAALRLRISADLVKDSALQPVPIEVSLQQLETQFGRGWLDRAYRGAYLGRSSVRHAKTAAELYGTPPQPPLIADELAALYPESLAQDLARLRQLEEEKLALQALHEGRAQAVGGVIQHRGRTLRRRELKAAIAAVDGEIASARMQVETHDRRVRTTHLAAAASLGDDWRDYLQGLAAIQHYADHAEANLRDAQGHLSNVYAIVTADGRVSKRERERLIAAGGQVHRALVEIHDQRDRLLLDPALMAAMKIESWPEAIGELKLPQPTQTNLGDWFGAVDSWINSAAAALSSLRLNALEQLLAAEARVAAGVRDGIAAAAAPAPASRPPAQYTALAPGSERARQAQLGWWNRFQLADGLLPGFARFAVAAAIVGTVLLVGFSVGQTAVVVYNGLEQPVRVEIGKQSAQVPALGRSEIEIAPAERYPVTTRTLDGRLIEQFDSGKVGGFSSSVYNVAGASPLLEWTAVYGNVHDAPQHVLGAPRWVQTSADIRFETPPASISSKTGGGSRSVISGFAERLPQEQLGMLDGNPQAARVVTLSHARWDPSNARHSLEWLSLAATDTDIAGLLASRLRETPEDVLLRRLEQDTSQGDAHRSVCKQSVARAAASADDADRQYLAARCNDDAAERDRVFAELSERWPDNPWLQQAAGYGAAEQARWPEAATLLGKARVRLPALDGFLAIDLYRIHRLLGSEAGPAAAPLGRASLKLQQLLALESGSGIPEGPLRAYHDLAQGQLDAALAHAAADTTMSARILRLAAASDGADQRLIQRAAALPDDQGLDGQTAWSALGLALRNRRDPQPFIAVLRQRGGRQHEIDQAVRFVQSAAPSLDEKTSERMLAGLDPEVRGQAYSAAAVALGNAAPTLWKTRARKLLFASERPNFG